MSTLMDHQIGIKKESTYGTPVTVNRFYPFLDGTKSDWNPRPRQGKGIPAGGRRSYLGSRRFLPTGQGEITIKVELESKGAGVLLDLAFGVSVVTTVTGGAQMNFHPGITGTLLPSATIQVVKVRNDGTQFAETYAGCTANKVTIEQPEDGIATLEVTFDALSYTTATGVASASYPSSPIIFDHSQASVGYGGSLTVPTTTALALGLTAFNDFRSWKVELDQKIDTGRWNINAGTRAQPTVGMPEIKFNGKVEFNATTVTSALTAGTINPWYCTWTTTEALSAGFTQMQVVIPQMALTKGLPEVKMGETVTFDVDAEVTNDGTNRDLYLCYRSTDTAL